LSTTIQAFDIAIEEVDGSPLVQLTVDITPGNQRAQVNRTLSDVISFDGVVTYETVSGVMQTTTLSGSTTNGWEVTVMPDQIISNGPGSTMFGITVAVPAGVADGQVETVTVRASCQMSVLTPTTATDTATITVENTTPDPEWMVMISTPRDGQVYETDYLRISGQAHYNLDDITSVEVKVCTGAWMVATGTTEWWIDYDCSLLDDGDHTVLVRARAGEEAVSPNVEITVTQDRPYLVDDPIKGDDPTKSPEPEGSMTAYLIIGVLVVVAVAVGYWVHRRRQMDTVDYITHYY
jgi:hypothetical protein